MSFFIQSAFDPATQFRYFAWVLTVIVSIVLHELAHGWMAIRCGDDTPRRLGRLTGNPLVHMGPFSLGALFLLGMAWGSMPIDPTRLRGKYAEAKVAFAGPATNLLIAVVCLTLYGLLLRFNVTAEPSQFMDNLYRFLLIAGQANLVLMVFNLFPVPPLDGSHILANFNRKYALFIDDPGKQGFFILGFIAVFAISRQLWAPLGNAATWFVRLVAGI